MISFQPSENNFEMKIQNSYHRYRGATMRFSEARHSEGNIRALRKSQPLIKVDPSCWTDIRLHRRLTPNIGVCYFYLCKQILIQDFSNFRPFKSFSWVTEHRFSKRSTNHNTVHCHWMNIWKACALELPALVIKKLSSFQW